MTCLYCGQPIIDTGRWVTNEGELADPNCPDSNEGDHQPIPEEI